MNKRYLAIVIAIASLGVASCSLLSPVDRQNPAREDAFLRDYDGQPLGFLKLKTLFAWLQENPIETFKEMRAQRPVITTKGIPTKAGPKYSATVLVANREDVIEVLDQWEVFSVRTYAAKMNDALGPFMLSRDNTVFNLVEKPYMRRIMSPADFPLIKQRVSSLSAEAIREGTRVIESPGNGRSVGRLEVVNSLARKVPIQLTGIYGGFPGPDEESMFRWSRATQTDFFKNIKTDPKIHHDGIQAAQEMGVYIKQLIAEKRAQLEKEPDSEDTILARMLKEGTSRVQSITDDRLIILTAGLLIGAGETSQVAIINSLTELMSRPEEFEGAIQAAKNDDDELLAQYVWEALRFRPGNSVLPRYAEQDYVLAKGTPRETAIAKGSLVLAATQSAMFDEASVPDPEEFKLDRPQVTYLHLGYGHHRCLGDYVSLIQVPQIVKSLLLLENLRPAPGDAGKIDKLGGAFPERYYLEFDLEGSELNPNKNAAF